MSALADAAPSGSNAAEYTVSELSGALKRTVESAFEHVRVRGEISGYRGPHSSGHAYFALKDDKARLEAVVWRTAMAKLPFKPEEGLEVIATGKLTTYPGSSKYQIVIDHLEPAGAGALMALLDERRRRLEAEGLFAAERKRPLPFLPRVVGVVTSPTGAVIRDIRHRIADRFPLHLLVWPVRVQGETCGAEVAAAIAGFNALEEGGPIPRPDLLIVARGGGSLEDLWGFNDEAVVRAAAASAIPLISAVGHETDWTLIDHASDRRAPTPTGAAEMAVPVKAELELMLASLNARLGTGVSRRLGDGRRLVAGLARAIPSIDMLLALPRRRLDDASSQLGRSLRVAVGEKRRLFGEAGGRLAPHRLDALLRDKRNDLRLGETRSRHALDGFLARRRQRFERAVSDLRPHGIATRSQEGRMKLDVLADRLERAFAHGHARRADRLSAIARVAASLDWRQVLQRGYAIVRDPQAKDAPITSAEALSPGMAFDLEFADGRRSALTTAAPRPSVAKSPRGKRGAVKVDQGSLF
ncbi:exodeoxyribonuclease 7 large subunit [Aureimonas endophytica]|uniref:Exodeoxyribonuclease 7 large subunit n=1 Tax=Aureimonas endophytica TaxID=2027858 RepID=A0A916ZHS9_9HYPH|nr:exodeoxyribonuclease VII large subunit [Aureimonas endophytica]GGD97399.1 exodeoxyribonuclease 7 large subunit [Aureimonas endophytica]